jgi:hypothetical protein
MITVQWAAYGELVFTGQEFRDDQYADALADYEERKSTWDLVRMILENDFIADDWIVLHGVKPKEEDW